MSIKRFKASGLFHATCVSQCPLHAADVVVAAAVVADVDDVVVVVIVRKKHH
jgi:hypothetical protein